MDARDNYNSNIMRQLQKDSSFILTKIWRGFLDRCEHSSKKRRQCCTFIEPDVQWGTQNSSSQDFGQLLPIFRRNLS